MSKGTQHSMNNSHPHRPPSQPRTKVNDYITEVATDMSKRAIENIEEPQEGGAWKKLCSRKGKNKNGQ